jgi:hypothetical protein
MPKFFCAAIQRFGVLAFCLSISCLLASAAQATLVDVSNPANVLSGATVTASDAGYPGLNTTTAVTDNMAPENDQDASFLFGNTPTTINPNSLAITGFDAPGTILDLRLFTAGDGSRLPTTITVYSDKSNTSGSLLTSSYATSLGTFSLRRWRVTPTRPTTCPAPDVSTSICPCMLPAAPKACCFNSRATQPAHALMKCRR